MPYQSCRYAPPPTIEGDPQIIICTDETGQEWYVPPDSLEGRWLEFIENDGEVLAYEETPEAKPAPDEELPTD